jgi:competence protein ComEA
VLGAGVRVVRWSSQSDGGADSQAALDRQVGAADSAAQANRRPKTRTRTGSRSRTMSAEAHHSESHHIDSGTGLPPGWRTLGPPGRDPPGYLNGKLDLDVATLSQIDSLPGVGPSVAKRMVADRAEHGPFQNLQALRRVSGVGLALLRRLDTLVTFSGTLRPLSATPESVSARPTPRRSRKR